MVQHELKYQQWLKQYRLRPFYNRDTVYNPYIISPRDLSRDVLQMCSSFQFLFFRWIVTSSELMMQYVSLVVKV